MLHIQNKDKLCAGFSTKETTSMLRVPQGKVLRPHLFSVQILGIAAIMITK